MAEPLNRAVADVSVSAIKPTYVQIAPTGKAWGAEVRNVDLNCLRDEDFDLIHRTWLDHPAVVIRGQQLTDGGLIAFSRRFGELDQAPLRDDGRRFVDAHAEIYVVSNVIENGRPIGGLGAGEALWHTDLCFTEIPPNASVLYALEVPPVGGATYFSNMYRAYESLSKSLQRRIENLRVKFVGSLAMVQGESAYESDHARDVTASPGVSHPLVLRHPDSGQRALYLGRRHNAYVGGLSLVESDALLEELWAHATRDEFVWGHDWRAGDLIVWDNRCTMHRRDAFDPTFRRVMHRTQIKGTERMNDHKVCRA
jgi:taurine dioxygenase